MNTAAPSGVFSFLYSLINLKMTGIANNVVIMINYQLKKKTSRLHNGWVNICCIHSF